MACPTNDPLYPSNHFGKFLSGDSLVKFYIFDEKRGVNIIDYLLRRRYNLWRSHKTVAFDQRPQLYPLLFQPCRPRFAYDYHFTITQTKTGDVPTWCSGHLTGTYDLGIVWMLRQCMTSFFFDSASSYLLWCCYKNVSPQDNCMFSCLFLLRKKKRGCGCSDLPLVVGKHLRIVAVSTEELAINMQRTKKNACYVLIANKSTQT